MRKYGKWLLVLGVMAASPAVASADGFLGGKSKPSLPFTNSAASQQAQNQAIAEQVAHALRNAQLDGYDVDIEVKDGVATIGGKVRNASHRALATQVAAGVGGVKQVQNNLRYVPQGSIQQASAFEPSAQPATVQQAAFDGMTTGGRGIQQVSHESTAPAGNQQVAEQIAASLSQAGLVGYDVEIRFNGGVATLGGNVATLDQRQAASAAVSKVPGVNSVNNQLKVNPTIQRTAFNPGMPQMPIGGGYPGMMPASMGQPGMMAPGLAPSPMGAAPASFSNPQLPGHAWPAYAQYPNSAAVTYPTQYSASAWPYIGPFYPYPQVPMGWREVSLEWDDGYWQLNFNKEKDKWYWILNPKSW